jgi:hypothetical protein
MIPVALPLEVIPYESVGSIRFGMSSLEVRAQLHEYEVAGEKAGAIDDFFDLGIRVHYGVHGGVEAVELSKPAQPLFEGKPLLGVPYRPLEAWFGTIDAVGVKLEHSGLTSPELGIRLYAPSAKRLPDTPVEVVTVFGREFYKDYIASIMPAAMRP